VYGSGIVEGTGWQQLIPIRLPFCPTQFEQLLKT
jgi:hypothetical protein